MKINKEVDAHLDSLNGGVEKINLIEQVDAINYIGITASGIKCTVLENQYDLFNGKYPYYYASDKYNILDQNFYITLGTAKSQPFYLGYVRVVAKNKEIAKEKFNNKYGFNKDGDGRYSGCYDEKSFLESFPEKVKNGGPEHEVIA